MNHIITAHTPLDPDMLKFRSLEGEESLSSLYEFKVELVSHSVSIEMNDLLGKPLTLEIATVDGSVRYLGGHIVHCALTGRETLTSRTYVYTVTLRPWLWYLTRTEDCRSFQNLSVVDILRSVFETYGFQVDERLLASYRSWEYCVQYQESDFAFVSRLMEQEGIYYYFRHEADQQVLVLVDDMSAHDPLPGYAMLPYLPPDRVALSVEEGVDQWHPATELCSGAYVVDDYDFRKPRADLSQRRANPLNAEHGAYGKYQWQGGYIEADQGEHYARVRLEEQQAGHARIHAHSRLRAIAPGYLFTLKDYPRQEENRVYLVVGVNYRLQEGGYVTGSSDARYDFDFVAQPASLAFRAPSATPAPRASGPQTAVVVGPAGQDIWTDQYGRVKLQFRWDRYGKRDENSSCWVRVSSVWAGSQYGGVHIPRIGQEVVVDFLNGQLDRPLVTGRIYNADQMPPFALPAAATQSGFVTRTPGGSHENANMLRFEDKPGAEQMCLHAERDYDVSVENDATESVGGNSATVVNGNSTAIVLGTQESFVFNQIGVLGTGFGVVGSTMDALGSVVTTVGSSVGATGSSVSATGNSGSSTGTSVSSTGLSVSATGVSYNTVGLSVTF
ncbi:type VI secretion system Vgr family protein [Paraburkholderia sp. BCC1884]|uniref:type VI secretion system Vgr family protein n=1 Tax=Paraburkholderia sp. BCC1884 TaxID=2562668 RepID=UPI00118273BB|nr:type VI secretion system tip protein TssI/VgrG [Paraburkholderia sp. BCC1884]